ncbi:MAG: RNA polymerase sigma factor [Gemmataceae bacterium]|nr:RNA polymerase sigma factor [Gemmataceae bacterium]
MGSPPLQTLLRQVRRSTNRKQAGRLDDGALLERYVRDRDEAAFELLVWRHERLVMSVCRRVIGDAHEAEDAFQATFLVLARKAGSVGKRGALASWLYQVAYRVALRARARAARRGSQALPQDGVPAKPDADLVDAEAWRELEPVLDEELSRLPEKYRAPVVLCYLEGNTYDEAARLLGCPLGTISTRLTRARELLRERLRKRGVALAMGALSAALTSHAVQAGVPIQLVDATVRIVGLASAGSAAVPAHLVPLTEGVMHAMLWTKLKTAVAVVAAAGFLGWGTMTFAPLSQADQGHADQGHADQRAAAGVALDAAAPDAAVPVQAGAEQSKHKIDKVPPACHGFSGSLVGKLVGKDHEKGWLVMEVRHVKNVWRGNKAKDPESCLGKTVKIEKVFGKFLDVLLALKDGDGVHVETKHVSGDNFQFLGEVLARADLPPKIIRKGKKKDRD